MKTFMFIFISLFISACASENLPDPIDQNTVPASLEEREEETYNAPDYIDRNDIEAQEEERVRDEESIYDSADDYDYGPGFESDGQYMDTDPYENDL